MVKYLIQDIIPNERRRNPTGDRRKATTPRREVDERQHHIAHEETHLKKQATTLHHQQPEVGIDESPVSPRTTGVHRAENPRTMIVDSMSEPEVADVTPPNVETAGAAYFEETNIDSFSHGSSRGGGGAYRNSASERSFWKNWLPWAVGSVLCTALTILILNYIGGAVVTVFPKKESIPMDLKLSAVKNPSHSELSFSVMKIDLEESREVPATGEKTLTAKASGKIIIYNTQTVAQRLIKNTRFQSTGGKVYRINDSVNVPKSTTKAGKVTPGSIEVVVYADEAGPDYNSPATDFTLPGLKGSPTFEKVYARGKGPIAGGASGMIKTVSDLDMKKASDDLRVQLETKLRTKARGDLAPSQLSFDKGIIVDLGDPALSKSPASTENAAVVTLTGTLYMVTFSREEFTKELVAKLVQAYKGETVTISNIEGIEVGFPDLSGNEVWTAEHIELTAKGAPNLEWSIDVPAIKKALLGMPKDSFNSIMTQFPTVELAKAKISPIWKHTFPQNSGDIKIVIGVSETKK